MKLPHSHNKNKIIKRTSYNENENLLDSYKFHRTILNNGVDMYVDIHSSVY